VTAAVSVDVQPPPLADRLPPLYALIDPLLADYEADGRDASQCAGFPALLEMRRDAWDDREVFLAESDAPIIEAHLQPYTVSVAANDDALIDRLTRTAVEQQRAALAGSAPAAYRFGGLIETWMAPTDLMRRLERMWTYPRSNRDRLTYLRFSEPRVLEALAHRLPPETLARWLGPVARWHFLGRDCRWHTLSGEPHYVDSGLGLRRTVAEDSILRDAALELGPSGHLVLLDLEAHARALADWQRGGRAVDASAHALAWAGIDQARRQGLASQPDKGAYATCWMRDNQCAEHEPVRTALARFRSHGEPFADVLDDLVTS
jgi:hypothetical protein